jgi:PPE-repeat protein
MRASANSAAAAVQHETAATAYTAALAAMPTLPELAANHVIHGVLVATNFFGINTIPIALNEADYVRMWGQAATTMSTYQAVANTAVGATPTTDPAPTIQKSNSSAQSTSSNPYANLSGDNPLGLPTWLRNILNQFGIGDSAIAHDPKLDYWFDTDLANFLQNFGINWNPAAGTVNGATYDTYADPSQAIYYVVRALEVFEDLQQFGTDFVQNPVAGVEYLISLELYDWPFHLEEIGVFLGQNPALFAAVAPAALAPAGVGAVGLAGLGAIPPPPTPVPAPTPAAVAPPVLPVVATAPTVAGVAGTAPGTAPGTSPAAAASAAAGPAPPTPPPGAGGPGFAPPYALAPPGLGAGAGMSTGAKTQEPTSLGSAKAITVAAAAAAASGRARQRRRRATQRGYSDEFMDMNIDVDPDWGATSTSASDQGAGNLGFAGTVSKGSEKASGLATLSGDEFGGGPSMPMLPGTWSPDAPEGDGKQN